MTRKIERTSKGIRDFLFDQLDALNSGETSPGRVNVAAKTAATILSSVKAEIEFARFQVAMGKAADAQSTLQPLKLA